MSVPGRVSHSPEDYTSPQAGVLVVFRPFVLHAPFASAPGRGHGNGYVPGIPRPAATTGRE